MLLLIGMLLETKVPRPDCLYTSPCLSNPSKAFLTVNRLTPNSLAKVS